MTQTQPKYAQIHTVDATTGKTIFSADVEIDGTESGTGQRIFTNPANWSVGATSAGWHQITSTLLDGGTVVAQAAGQATTLNIAVQTAPFAGNLAAMNVVTNSGLQTQNLSGITRALITNYNIQMAGGTLHQFESTAAVVGTTAGATGTVDYGYCLSGEFLHGNTGGLTMTAVDGTLGDITLQSSGNIATARGVYGYVTDTAGQTGVYSTLAMGMQAAWNHLAATTWPEAWGMVVSPTSSGTGAVTTLGGGIKISLWGNTTGAWASAYGIYVKAPVNSTGLFTTIWGQRIDNQGGANTTKSIGMFIADQSGATNNVSLALGSNSAPATTAVLFVASANPIMLAAPTTLGGQTAPVTGLQTFFTAAVLTSGTPVLSRWTGVAHTGMAIAEALSIDFNLGQTLTFGAAGAQIGTQRVVRISPPTYTAASGTQDFGTLATLDITNAPNTVASLTTVGNVYCLMVGITGANIANKAATVYSAIAAPAATITLLNTTQLTSTVGASMAQLGQLTINQSGGAVIVNQATTLDVVGPPIAGASVTVTSLWSVLVRSGSSFFGGAIVQGHATAAINSTNTATAAQAATGYITSTSAALTTITLPTGTALGAALGAVQGTIHNLYIDNTAGANQVTIAVNTNAILSADAVANAGSAGLLTVPSGVTGQACFRLMFSSATAYTFSRIA